MLHTIASASTSVQKATKRNTKVQILATLLQDVDVEDLRLCVHLLSGETCPSRLGIGWKRIEGLELCPPVDAAEITLAELGRQLELLANISGKGAVARRADALRSLFERCTQVERNFLSEILRGALRQGANELVLLAAVSKASKVPARLLRRAWMFSGDLSEVARSALDEGTEAISAFTLRVFTPVRPMLAKPISSAADAVNETGEVILEPKLDGVRVQVHKDGREVRLYSRSLKEFTNLAPEVVQLVRDWKCQSIVVDGEVLSYDGQGRPLPFQDTMRRFGRVHDISEMQREVPLRLSVFDCLELDGRPLVDEELQVRKEALTSVVSIEDRVPFIRTNAPNAAEAFYDDVLGMGHEGVMAKSPHSLYVAGSRTGGWLKIKPHHTVDLVVLAAEWGSGRRAGSLSNLHLGAREPSGDYAMVGKTFKGLTDASLSWQTKELLAREVLREDNVVYVRPELVIEVAFSDVQRSNQYSSGVALRFARVRRYRQDLDLHGVDTLSTLERMMRKGHRASAD